MPKKLPKKLPMKLPKDFYLRSTKTVAKDLLGKQLVHVHKGKRISGIITETEAYLGITDKACHTYGGRKTERVQCMYLEGGHAYLYFIYGMYWCFNVVTRSTKHPEAVLIRSLEPDEGVEQMQFHRRSEKLNNLTTGPGKLCQALHLNKDQNGLSLLGDELFIEDAPAIPRSKIVERPRIGVLYAGEHAEWELRFYIQNNPFISKK